MSSGDRRMSEAKAMQPSRFQIRARTATTLNHVGEVFIRVSPMQGWNRASIRPPGGSEEPADDLDVRRVQAGDPDCGGQGNQSQGGEHALEEVEVPLHR